MVGPNIDSLQEILAMATNFPDGFLNDCPLRRVECDR
jgi:hypothetical protein